MEEFHRLPRQAPEENQPEQIKRALQMIAELRDARLQPTGNVQGELNEFARIEDELKRQELTPNDAVAQARALLESRNEP